MCFTAMRKRKRRIEADEYEMYCHKNEQKKKKSLKFEEEKKNNRMIFMKASFFHLNRQVEIEANE
jgi:hypothetical protein